MEDLIPQLKAVLLKGGLAAIAVGVAVILYRYLLHRYYQKHDHVRPQPSAPAATTEAEEQDDGTIPLANRSNVKRWKVSGVEKANGNDATWFIEAESRANAKVKAELKGMIVTAVERASA